jgi:hypothetical protein
MSGKRGSPISCWSVVDWQHAPEVAPLLHIPPKTARVEPNQAMTSAPVRSKKVFAAIEFIALTAAIITAS